MKAIILVSIRAALVTLVLTGLLYPLVVTGLARLLFPSEAEGGIVQDASGAKVGAKLIGQVFAKPEYFQGRPSDAGAGYDAKASSGSNLGVTSKKLIERIRATAEKLRGENPDAGSAIPDDLVTSSASGLDPHLSPAAALWQVPRVAKARGVARERVRGVVERYVEGRDLGLFGEPRVNVLLLNLAMDRQFGKP